jgi:uncharacterized membrane-anchored protein
MRYALSALLALFVSSPVSAQDSTAVAPTANDSLTVAAAIAQFETTLHYQTGDVQLPNGIATIHVPEGFRYLDKKNAQHLLTDGWENPKEASEDVIGMLVPPVGALGNDGWGIIITMDESGYVDDKDAAKLDYSKILEQMRKGAEEANKERKKHGFPPATLVGWAEPPHYDAANHKLYWAKELAFGDEEWHTVNYCIRVLGRRGVLELNAVAPMDLLDEIHASTPAVLSAIEFNQGHRYADFIKGKDQVAKLGLAGLIVGVAAKAGFFKALLVAIVALKKVIIVGVVALIAWLKRVFGKKKMPTTFPEK